jgi:hypothetical protein
MMTPVSVKIRVCLTAVKIRHSCRIPVVPQQLQNAAAAQPVTATATHFVNPLLSAGLTCCLLHTPAGKKWVSWWVSRVSLCTADAATLQPVSCSDYDPRSWKDEECMWSAGFESLGKLAEHLVNMLHFSTGGG